MLLNGGSARAFQDLGIDLTINILSYLHPKEIITVRKTCSALYAATQHRSLWIHHFRAVMDMTGVPQCAFPSPTSLSLRWLEHITLAPFKFIDLIESSARPDEFVIVEPKSMRTITNDIAVLNQYVGSECPPFDAINPPQFFELLPLYGGRYLATLIRQRYTTFLQMWDLGVGGAAAIRLLATKVVPALVSLSAVIPKRDGTGVFVVVTVPFATLFITFVVDGIGGTEPISFVDYGNLQIPYCYIYLPNNVEGCMVCLNREGLFLWDLEQNKTWAWKIALEVNYNSAMVYRYSDVLIISTNKDVFIFDLPDLSTAPIYTPSTPLDSLPVLECSLHLPTPCEPLEGEDEGVLAAGGLLARNTAQRSPEYFATFDRRKFYLQEVKPLLPSDQRVPRRQPIVVGVFDVLPFMESSSWIDFGPMQSVQDRVVLGWINSSGEDFNVTRFPVAPHSQPITIRLGKGAEYTFSLHNYFYSATGRGCFLTSRGEIHIMEYLETPVDPLLLQ